MRLSSLLMFAGIKAPILMELWDFLITALLFISVIGNNIPQYMVLVPILLTYMVYAKVLFQVVTYSLHILVVYTGNKIFQNTPFWR